ncbi:threonine ammonia-lyase [Anthropogastromicrobium aceti]|uniref:threonine ammonia-lyase n=1 Tax=Anthropogastromicrobium aceti TaxID=2981768 RepID=A0AAE3E6U5_9FIRM|nr:threonine ammonia-lyase [Anthropogastromicrobium aceti]MCC2222733.1 threonine ammonia-lyase [Anthropogastromicrobium aceti]
MEELTLEKFEEASEIVSRVTLETKLKYSEYFSNQTGNKVYFKPENMQYTGAYKVRGAYYKISTLSEEDRAKGIITASAGNHAQGVAYAAKLYNAKAVIVMPTNTPLIKINRTKSYGAEVVLYGDVYDDACEHALKLAEEHGYTFIHAFNDLDVACGQGSIAMEIIKELPTVDYILCPIGGGGLCTGVSTLAKMLNPKIKVIGVEPEDANCMQESLKADHVVSLPSVNTIADGTAVRTPGDKLFPYIKANVDEIITVPDDELIGAFLDMIENHKMVVENSGLLTVAALKHLDVKNKKIVSILSGGNMDVITMSSVVQHGLIQRGRIFSVSCLLPDKPGELAKVASLIAQVKGNIIKLDHNQFITINRSAAVELKITMESFGESHKKEIIAALAEGGFRPKEIRANL